MKHIIKFLLKHSLIVSIIIAIVFGLGGGLVGEIIARAYFIDSLSGLSLSGNLDFSSGKYADQGLVISNPKNVIVQQDAKVDEMINSVGNSLVGIYKKLSPKKGKQESAKLSNAFQLENFYKINEPSGQGFVLTSDGWIVTSLTLAKNYNDYVVITKDKTVYQIDKAVVDNLTSFSFVHVKARDLLVRKFAESQTIKGGSLAVAVDWQGFGLVSSVIGFSKSASLIKYSDSFYRKLLLSEKLPGGFEGSIVFNLAGDTLGLVNSRGEIEPISHLAGAIKSLFKSQTVVRPSLGVNYIDLAELAEISNQGGYLQKGVVIYKPEKSLAIKKNSPAEKSGLREGDIIISVDSLELNKDNNLNTMVQDHLVGETLNLIISRQGEEREIKVSLEAIN